MEEKHWRKSQSILTEATYVMIYSSLTIFSSSVTSISSLHRLTSLLFSFELSFSLSHFLHCHQMFFLSVSFKPFLNCQAASYLATLTNIFDKIWRCVGQCQLKSYCYYYTLIQCTALILNVFRFNLISILQCTYFLLVKKSMLFPYEKVVITQFDTCRWFYAPIYAKCCL